MLHIKNKYLNYPRGKSLLRCISLHNPLLNTGNDIVSISPMITSVEWCDGKYLTTTSCGGGEGWRECSFVAFTDFCSIITPTMTDFKLLM